MAAKIETAFSFDADDAPDSPPKSAPQEGAAASSRGTRQYDRPSDYVVGAVPQGMTDEDREAAICRAGAAMQAWYSHYQANGNPAHLDCAYHCLGVMRTLIAGRSPAQVARMEAARGLDLPACANEAQG